MNLISKQNFLESFMKELILNFFNLVKEIKEISNSNLIKTQRFKNLSYKVWTFEFTLKKCLKTLNLTIFYLK